MFSIITPMTNTTTQSEERHNAVLIRNFRKKCPDDLLAESDLSDLLDTEL